MPPVQIKQVCQLYLQELSLRVVTLAQVATVLAETDTHAALHKFPGPLVPNTDSKLLGEYINTTVEELNQSQSDATLSMALS